MRTISVIAICFFLMTLPACRKHKTVVSDNDVLLTLHDSTLMLRDVEDRIPPGLEPEDSVEMFDALVSDWISNRLLGVETGTENPEIMARIDRMTEEYRRHLIATYLFRTMDVALSDIPEDSIKAYYSLHARELLLQRPIVKGAFLKIDAASPEMDIVRKYMEKPTPEAVEKIERYAANDIISLQYFGDRWVDIAEVADLFPSRPSDLDALARNKITEMSRGQSISILSVTDMIGAGEIPPYEFAQIRIREIFRAGARRASERNLLKNLFEKARSSGEYTPGTYDISRLSLKN